MIQIVSNTDQIQHRETTNLIVIMTDDVNYIYKNRCGCRMGEVSLEELREEILQNLQKGC